MIYLNDIINTTERIFPGFNYMGNCYAVILYPAKLSIMNADILDFPHTWKVVNKIS